MMKRLILCGLLCLLLAVPVSALEVRVDGAALPPGSAYEEDGVTWVALRRAGEAWGAAVSWDGSAAHLGEVAVRPGAEYLTAAGRCFFSAPIRLQDGVTWAPARALAAAVGASVEWEPATQTVLLGAAQGIAPAEAVYDADELYWLSRIISAEAGGESLRGQIAVGNVVLARVASEAFPDTVYGVVFDRQDGVQFTPTANGTIWNEPEELSVIAAKLCLEGAQTAPGCLYFFDPAISSGSWIRSSCSYVTTIGCHAFYA